MLSFRAKIKSWGGLFILFFDGSSSEGCKLKLDLPKKESLMLLHHLYIWSWDMEQISDN